MYYMYRTKVLFRKEEFKMTGWSLFFVLVGVAFLTAQVFRLVDAIERPARRTTRRRHAAANY